MSHVTRLQLALVKLTNNPSPVTSLSALAAWGNHYRHEPNTELASFTFDRCWDSEISPNKVGTMVRQLHRESGTELPAIGSLIDIIETVDDWAMALWAVDRIGDTRVTQLTKNIRADTVGMCIECFRQSVREHYFVACQERAITELNGWYRSLESKRPSLWHASRVWTMVARQKVYTGFTSPTA